MAARNGYTELLVDLERTGTFEAAIQKGVGALREIGSRYGRRGGAYECKIGREC